jgi:hypothetical protein
MSVASFPDTPPDEQQKQVERDIVCGNCSTSECVLYVQLHYIQKVTIILRDNLQRGSHKPYGPPN